MTLAADTPVDFIRRINEKASLGESLSRTDAEWLAKVTTAYLAAGGKMSMDKAMGLAAPKGKPVWGTLEARAERTAVVREMKRQLFGQLDLPGAAKGIKKLIEDRKNPSLALNERMLLARLARTEKVLGALPEEQQIKNIIK